MTTLVKGSGNAKYTLARTAASVFNSTPHIDDCSNDALEKIAIREDVPISEPGHYYYLPHHHFKLKPGEVCLFDVNENEFGDTVEVKVSCVDWTEDMKPFQYYSDGNSYIPVGFTYQEKYQINPPEKHIADLGVISNQAFVTDTVEITDEERRVQTLASRVESHNLGLNRLYTMVNKRLVKGQSDQTNYIELGWNGDCSIHCD